MEGEPVLKKASITQRQNTFPIHCSSSLKFFREIITARKLQRGVTNVMGPAGLVSCPRCTASPPRSPCPPPAREGGEKLFCKKLRLFAPYNKISNFCVNGVNVREKRSFKLRSCCRYNGYSNCCFSCRLNLSVIREYGCVTLENIRSEKYIRRTASHFSR